jgi:hypothetical protein
VVENVEIWAAFRPHEPGRMVTQRKENPGAVHVSRTATTIATSRIASVE